MTMCLVLVGLFAITASWASSVGRLKAEIPFAFFVGGKQLPAGEYVISSNERVRSLAIQQIDGAEFVRVLAQPAPNFGGREGNFLSFRKYGTTYFLGAVHSVETPVSGLLLKSRQEKIIASEMAKANGENRHAQVRLAVNAE